MLCKLSDVTSSISRGTAAVTQHPVGRRDPVESRDFGEPRALSSRRDDVLDELRRSAVPLTIVEIADRLGIHPNTVRFHLNTLVRHGRAEQVQITNRGRGRPALAFTARRRMDPGGPRNYRLLAAILASGLAAGDDAIARATDAGRRWGMSLVEAPTRSERPTDRDDSTLAPRPSARAAIGGLMTLLRELDFAPERRRGADGVRIGLRHCPFLELADGQSQLVCPAHLGLMQGAMSALRAPVTVERLEPFAEPDLCLVHLASGTAAGEDSADPSGVHR
jgi:predicted ArsR family transcriptional regulator